MIIANPTPTQAKLLKEIIRNRFDTCPWYQEEELINLAIKLGFTDLADEMMKDSKADIIGM